jgi:hypothetical protein
MSDNPYEAPQEQTIRHKPRPSYDPLAISRRLTRIFWIVGFIVGFVIVALILLDYIP